MFTTFARSSYEDKIVKEATLRPGVDKELVHHVIAQYEKLSDDMKDKPLEEIARHIAFMPAEPTKDEQYTPPKYIDIPRLIANILFILWVLAQMAKKENG